MLVGDDVPNAPVAALGQGAGAPLPGLHIFVVRSPGKRSRGRPAFGGSSDHTWLIRSSSASWHPVFCCVWAVMLLAACSTATACAPASQKVRAASQTQG